MRLSAVPLTTLLFTAVISNTSVKASENDYLLCTTQLTKAGISADNAATSCAAVLSPKDLTACVFEINRKTNIAAVEALNTCRQVRLPRSLAYCVVNISLKTPGAPAADVLDNCRRSLIPVNFAKCVVGLNQGIDIPAVEAMATCIDASDRPRDFYPPIIVPQNTVPIPSVPVPQPVKPDLR